MTETKPTSPVTRAGEEMIQANSSASEKVCDHPSTEKAVQDLRLIQWLKEMATDFAFDNKTDLKQHICWIVAGRLESLIAHPANSLRGQPESDSLYYELMALYNASRERERELTAEVERLRVQAEPSLLGRETVREETIEECAKVCDALVVEFGNSGLFISDAAAGECAAAIRSLSPLKE